jgi:Tol biopolymer transport system component
MCIFVAIVVLLLTFTPHAMPIAANADETAASDGSMIAFISPSRDNQQVQLISPAGGEARTIWRVPADTPRQYGIGSLSWRPDGSEVAFDSGHERFRSMHARDLYAVTPDGSRFRRITNSPDPTSLAALPVGTVQVRVANPSLTGAELEVYVEGGSRSFRFLAQPRTEYDVTLNNVADLGPNVRQFVRVLSITPNTSGRLCHYEVTAFADVVANQTVTAGRVSATEDFHCPTTFSPSWRSDGTRLIFLSREASRNIDPPNNIWQIEASPPPTALGERILDMGQFGTTDKLYMVAMASSPALADEMLFVRNGALNTPVFRANARDAAAATLVDLGRCPRNACAVLGLAWLPDGSGFLFSRQEDGAALGAAPPAGGALYRYDFERRQATQLLRLPDEGIGRIALSPDGRSVVFERGPGLEETVERVATGPRLRCPCDLWLVERDGSNARLLVRDARAPAWSARAPQAAPPLTPRVWLPLISR